MLPKRGGLPSAASSSLSVPYTGLNAAASGSEISRPPSERV